MNECALKNAHRITAVAPGSIGEEMGIEAGDALLAINDQEVTDIFDYRFLIQDDYIEALVRRADGEEWVLEIEKDFDEDLGLTFENGLMSDYRSCSNRCLFCFIDQMPPGMRDTLYFKDDDSRLSFLQGNYITLTNMGDRDIDRIVRLQMAPINISVHTTNPALRCRMLGNRFAGEKLRYLKTLYSHQVPMNGQIVCCKGLNDGEELRRTIADLAALQPWMASLSVVPAGVTRFREGLPELTAFTAEEAGAVIDLAEGFQEESMARYGRHFVHASDEWYIQAGRPFPEAARYDGYIQLENGVGMMRLLMDSFDEALAARGELGAPDRTVAIATGELAYPTLKALARRMMDRWPGLTVEAACIRNAFFGETITVSGLITGQDLVNQIRDRRARGEVTARTLLIPTNMLRTGEQVFLDDMTVDQVEAALEMDLVAVAPEGGPLVDAVLGIPGTPPEANDRVGYIQAY